jgi:hypothetical protein
MWCCTSADPQIREELLAEAKKSGVTEIDPACLSRGECIGAGGFGKVYHATWGDKGEVAVKELNYSSLDKEVRYTKVKELLREGGVGAACFHA